MKKFNMFVVWIFSMILIVSCSSSPSGNPKQDLATFHKLVEDGKINEASQFCDEVMEYYTTHYNGSEAKEKLQEFGDNM